MSTHSKVDPSTLSWVKTEIDETLKEARLALESFAENPSDKTRLRFCITHLHQVLGTLLMVELDGAALLAREAEALAEAVLHDKAEAGARVFEALTRVIATLPDYLARLQFGQPDVPLRHLPLINELRAARRAEPLSEGELFSPDLSVRPAPSAHAQASLSLPEFGVLAKQLRPTFQSALLNWLRDVVNKTPLAEIIGVLEQLQVPTALSVLEQLFWVAGGFLEALSEGGLEANPERKKLLARLDQQIKKLIDGAEKSELRRSSEDLTRALLWEVAQAQSYGPRVAQLKQAFGLDALLGSMAEAEAATQESPSPEVLQSVAAALAKEIERAQDTLSAYFDPAQTGTTSLEPLLVVLHRMSGTLDMLGAPSLQALADELSETAGAILDGRIGDLDAAAMPMAQALLLIENGVRDVHRAPSELSRPIADAVQRLRALHAPDAAAPAAEGLEVSEGELTETDFKQLVSVVAAEVGINLNRIEEAIETFAKDYSRPELLAEVPPLLSQILGAMQILGQERAAELVVAAKQCVEDIRGGVLAPSPAILDALAVSISTVATYLDGLHSDRPNLDKLLDAAFHDLEAARAPSTPAAAGALDGMRARLEAWLRDPGDGRALEAIREALEQLAAAPGAGQEKAAHIVSEMSSLLRLVADGEATLSPEVATTLRQSLTTLETFAGQPRAPHVQPAAPAKKAPPAEDIDEEIVGIFIEDAREQIDTIHRELAAWRDDKDNQQALLELRRAYHTLKGSGRMVGATQIAEFAWAVENLLNRVRDGRIAYSEAVLHVLDDSLDALPQMVDQLAGGAPPAVDTEALREAAHALAQPGAPALSAAAAVTARSGEALPVLDGTLREIFTNEARGHLVNVRQELALCRSGARHVSEKLFRSAHTLAGNARSLGITMMAETCSETEGLLRALRAHNLALNDEQLDVVVRLETAVSELVDLIALGAASGGGLGARFARIAHDAQLLSAHLHETPAELVEEIEITAPPPPPETAAPSRPPARSARAGAPEPIAGALGHERTAPAAAKPAPAPAPDRIDPELLEIFLEEGTDILNAVEETLTRWRANRGDRTLPLELKRALHTLKGGARMAGAMTIGELAHTTESLLRLVEERRLDPSAELFDLLDEAHDMLVSMLARVKSGAGVPPGARALFEKLAVLVPGTAIPASVHEVPAPVASDLPASAAHPEAQAPAAEPAPREAAPPPEREGVTLAELPDDRRETTEEEAAWPEKLERRGQIKVDTGLLSELVNFAGEVSISRARMEQQIYSFRDNLGELSRNVVRFREQIRELEIQSESQILYRVQDSAETRQDSDFDPLEFDRFSRLQQLSRGLAESLHDLNTIQTNLGNFVGEAEAVLQQQARINTELQEGLMRTRMVSFATQAARLRHIVRQTARELGKRVELELKGAEVEVDRTVLDRMIGPFEHMIRNSVDHGIESEAERRRRGKPPFGHITIATVQEGSEVVIRFSDDGGGLNIEAIRAKAIERGLVSSEAALTEDELVQFILMSGFSTASQITQVSGRGVGMDVVHNEVKQLGGSMAVNSKRDTGTTFVIRLPLTLSITQALMVHVGDQLYAVPLASVSNIVEFPIEKLTGLAVGKNPLFNYQERVYPFMSLGTRLGLGSQAVPGKKVPVLLARTGTREVAIQVDGLSGTREVVIKTLGSQLSEIKGLAGATILGDGRVILILDVPGLWYRDDTIRVEHRAEAKPAAAARERPLIMVVDDSLTVRKVTGKHLHKRGMDVMVAKDGIDAVEQLRDRIPDVMLVDIEMPRMDGYELTTRVRSDTRLRRIPIIMITSRAGAKHRQKAFELGVDGYMSKPYQEEELLKNIEAMLSKNPVQP